MPPVTRKRGRGPNLPHVEPSILDKIRPTRSIFKVDNLDNDYREPEAAKPDRSKVRQCLRCGDQFLSEWAGNRLCNRCKWGDPPRPCVSDD